MKRYFIIKIALQMKPDVFLRFMDLVIKTSTCLFIILGINNLKSQAPGCPNVTVSATSNTVGCTTPCTTLSAGAFNIGQTTSYSVSSIPFAPPYPICGPGTGVSVNTDDVYSPVINLPFPFCFFGNTYNQCVIGSNGVISFDVSQANGYCNWSYSASCPSSSLPNPAIFGVYEDIDPSLGGSVTYTLIGSAPCRMLVVNFCNVPYFSCGSSSGTAYYSMVLYETTNVIEVYVQSRVPCIGWNSGNGVIGIQNAGGTIGYTPPGRNTGAWTASNEAWRFTPTGPLINGPIQWFDNTGLIATSNTVQVCPTSNTTYTAVTTYTRCDGFTITVSAPITINNSYTVTNNSPICAGQTLSLSVTGAPANATYTWTGPSGFTSNLQNPVITNTSPNQSGNYTVTIGNGGNNCNVVTNVTIIGQGATTITPSTTLCPGSNFSLTANTAGGNPNLNYNWLGPGGFSSNQQNPTINNVSTPNTGTYSLTVSYVSGTLNCSSNYTTSLYVIPIYTPVATANQTVCVGDNATISATATSASSYSWSGPNNYTSTSQSNVIANAQTNYSGTYTVYAIFNAGTVSCSTSTITNITILPKMNFTLPLNPNICPGDPISINGPAGASSFTWTNPYGQVVSNQQNLNIPNANFGMSGVYTLSLQPNGGCVSSNTTNVTVLTPISFSIVPSDITLCKGDSATTFAMCIGGSGVYTYQWFPYSGLYFPSGFANIVKPQQSTYYTIIANDVACPQQTITSNFWVNVLPLPTPNFIYDKIEGCKPLCVKLNSNSQPPSINTIWDFGYNLYANGDSVNYCFNKPGVYPVKVSLIDSNGCKNTVQAPFSINVFPRPEPAIYFNPNAPTLLKNEVQFEATYNNGPITYWHWDFGDIMTNSDTSNIQNPIYTYTYVANYPVMLIATNIYGCTDTVYRLISVNEEFTMYIPDVFTPNGDGLNDLFIVKGAGFVEEGFEMRIYDRWGELIYKTNDVMKGWDGTVKGTPAKNDVYIYKIRCFTTVQNIKKEFVGHVTLYR